MFAVSVSQNPYLPPDGGEVHAVVTISAKPDNAGAAAQLAEGLPIPASSHPVAAKETGVLVFGILLDCSGSMSADNDSRMEAARQAVLKVIHLLSPESYFFIVAGRNRATVVIPVCRATQENKLLAHKLVRQLRASDGTCMSYWLREAKYQFDYFQLKYPKITNAIFQVLLLTDGKNDDKDPLPETVQDCLGAFQCHARGVGIDWQVSELRYISNRLLGTIDIIREPGQISEDFQSILAAAQSQVFNHVRLRVWVPQGASIESVKQVSPELLNLIRSSTGEIDKQKPNTIDYATGSWSEMEERDYHLVIRVRPGQVGQKMLAARVSAVRVKGPQVDKLGEGQVLALWTHDESRTTVLNPTVAHYTGQSQLSSAIQEGLAARSRGDEAEATRKLGLAVKLAEGNESTTRLLRRVVDIIDSASGTVKLRRVIDEADAMALDTRSTKTRRILPSTS